MTDRWYGLRHTVRYWVGERANSAPSHRPERMSIEIQQAADLLDERDALCTFVSGVACIGTGKIRADANVLLEAAGLPTIPLSASPDEAMAIQAKILDALGEKTPAV